MGKGSKSTYAKLADKRTSSSDKKKKLIEVQRKNESEAPVVSKEGKSREKAPVVQGITKLNMCEDDEARLLRFLAVLSAQEQSTVDDTLRSDEGYDIESDSDDSSVSSSGDSDSDSDSDSAGSDEGNGSRTEGCAAPPIESSRKKKSTRTKAEATTESKEIDPEAFKRSLIRSDRLQSRNDMDTVQMEKSMTRLAVTGALGGSSSSSSSSSAPIAAPSKVKSEKKKEGSSGISSASKKINGNIRVALCCDKKKTDVKRVVLDRLTPPAAVLDLCRKKFNLASASSAKRFNALRVVVDLAGGEFKQFRGLQLLQDDVQIQLFFEPEPREGDKIAVATTAAQEECEDDSDSNGPSNGVTPKLVQVNKFAIDDDVGSDSEESESCGVSDAVSDDGRVLPPPPSQQEVESNNESVSPLPSLPPVPPPPPPPPVTEASRAVSARLKQEYDELTSPANVRYQALLAERKKLPIYEAKDAILSALRSNQVVVVSGETGSGKTTQLPTYILDEMLAGGRGSEAYIICTQPRRIAAITVAERVSYERCESSTAGNTIGYQVRLQSVCSDNTRILHCTTGVLLRKMQDPTFLSKVSHVVMDEVHERQVETDFLMALLKAECARRAHLKLILMSATLQENLFADYFSNSPVVYVSGRTHPVENHYMHEISQKIINKTSLSGSGPRSGYDDDMMVMSGAAGGPAGRGGGADKRKQQRGSVGNSVVANSTANSLVPPIPNNIDVIVETIAGIIKRFRPTPSLENRRTIFSPSPSSSSTPPAVVPVEAGTGDAILVFLSGVDTIDKVAKALKQKYYRQLNEWNAYIVSLHGSMQASHQKMAFKPSKPGEWKIVLSTNIAETSVTVPDVTHVVDSGLVKEMRYEPSTNLSTLCEVAISRASARQRAGRAGRVRPGHCWRLYSESYHDGVSPSFSNCPPPAGYSTSATNAGSSRGSDSVAPNAGPQMQQYAIPEIKRIPLEEVLLQVLLLHLDSIHHTHPVTFLKSCLESPSDSQIRVSVENLIGFGAVTPVLSSTTASATSSSSSASSKSTSVHVRCGLKLSPLGMHLAQLPVDIHIGKMLIMGSIFKCIVPVLTIAAALSSSKSMFVTPSHNSNKRVEASAAHRKFSTRNGEFSDHIGMLNAYNEWDRVGSCKNSSLENNRNGKNGDGKRGGSAGGVASAYHLQQEFCAKNYLNHHVLEEMRQLRQFYRRHLEQLGFLARSSATAQGGHSVGVASSSSSADGNVEDSSLIDFVPNSCSSAAADDDDIQYYAVSDGKGDAAWSTATASSTAKNNESAVATVDNDHHFSKAKAENALLRCVVGSGLFPHFVRVCRSDGKGKSHRGGPGRADLRPIAVLDRQATNVFVHPSSVLHGQMGRLLEEEGRGREAIIAYYQKVATSQIFVRDCTCVPILGVLLLCGRLAINKTRTTVVAGGGWLKFKTSSELQAVLYRKLQLEIDSLLQFKIQHPTENMEQKQDQLIAIVKELLM